jgi:hypothetical protein
MFDKLPSLLGFEPKCYSGGPTRFYLPLLCERVTSKKPKSIVTLGFGDGQAFFSFARLREAGYWIVWTPHTELVRHESASCWFDESTPQQLRFLAEIDYMNAK